MQRPSRASITCFGHNYNIYDLTKVLIKIWFQTDKKYGLAEEWMDNTKTVSAPSQIPRSRRNLMVFDVLTPPQGHEFNPRVTYFIVSLSADLLQFDMPHDHVQKI